IRQVEGLSRKQRVLLLMPSCLSALGFLIVFGSFAFFPIPFSDQQYPGEIILFRIAAALGPPIIAAGILLIIFASDFTAAQQVLIQSHKGPWRGWLPPDKPNPMKLRIMAAIMIAAVVYGMKILL